MRGRDNTQISMMCALNPEDMIPRSHPLRSIKKVVQDALEGIDSELEGMYSKFGRASIPPERLLKSMILMALFSVRSDRQLCEQVHYNLLFRWFLNMEMTEQVWDHSTFSHNRARLMEHRIARRLFESVLHTASVQGLVSEEHFSVDGTLIEAWASMKSFVPKDKSDDSDDSEGSDSNRWVNFRGQKRSNDTHESKTDSEARLMRKGAGKEAKLSFSGHALMENRNGLVVDFEVTEANGTAEREVGLKMLKAKKAKRKSVRITVGADAGYNVKGFVAQCRRHGITPHVARGRKAKGAIDGRTTRHCGYGVSQRIRKRVEEVFGWVKTIGGLAKSRFVGIDKTDLAATMAVTALNAMRIAKLTANVPTG